jgi:hypothetical protein
VILQMSTPCRRLPIRSASAISKYSHEHVTCS